MKYFITISILILCSLLFSCENKVKEKEVAKHEMDSILDENKSINPSNEKKEITKNKYPEIKIGTTADDVLAIRGKALGTNVIGNDDNGLIVEWKYSDAVYTMKRTSLNSPYKVAKVR